MSHIEEGKTSVVFADLPALIQRQDLAALAQHPCIVLLRQAVALMAKQYGGEVKPHYYDYNYKEQSANTGLALHIPQSVERLRHALPRGIGLVIDCQTGALEFRGDPWYVDPHFYQQMQKGIVQKYTVLAHMAALRQMHYQVTSQEVEGHVNITGVTYA